VGAHLLTSAHASGHERPTNATCFSRRATGAFRVLAVLHSEGHGEEGSKATSPLPTIKWGARCRYDIRPIGTLYVNGMRWTESQNIHDTESPACDHVAYIASPALPRPYLNGKGGRLAASSRGPLSVGAVYTLATGLPPAAAQQRPPISPSRRWREIKLAELDCLFPGPRVTPCYRATSVGGPYTTIAMIVPGTTTLIRASRRHNYYYESMRANSGGDGRRLHGKQRRVALPPLHPFRLASSHLPAPVA